MKPILFRLSFSLFFFLTTVKSKAVNITGNIMSGGVSRSFVLHAPGSTVGANLPVMIIMHGDGGSGAGIQSYSGFDAVADAQNFIAIYPNAVAGSWKRALGETEDVQFIGDLIDYLCTTYTINKQKVYASGHSAGGFMTYNLATNLATKIAAFAPVAGSMYSIAGYNYNSYFGTSNFIKVPIYHIHGDADGTVAYPDPDFTPVAWAEWPFFQFTYGSFGSCGATTYTSSTTLVPGVQQNTFCNGSSGTNKPVHLIRMIGGGHGWPTATGYNAAQRIWDFCNAFSIAAPSCVVVAPSAVTYTINTTTGQSPISNLIYGINGTYINTADKNTSFRMGGTRLNGYNWENNASHAGVDYFNHNDDYMCNSWAVPNCNTPGAAITSFVNKAKAVNGYTLVTLPNVGYVSADKLGTPVTAAEAAPSVRWIPTQNNKGAAFTTTPNLTDNKVYVDEEINFITSLYNTAANGGVNAYNLTNEAGIWQAATPMLHPSAVTTVDVINKSVDLAKTIKNIDATAEVFGGSFYGFSEYYDLQSAADWPAIKAANPTYKWYIDHYLNTFKNESVLANKRLMDVISFHWYPEAQGNNRIINQNAYTANDIAARLQAPRSLWDPSYTTYTTAAPYTNGENSWIFQNFANGSWTGTNYFPLINTIKNSINTFYPNTKLAFGEYNFGGGNQITGGLTQVDVLGIFGKQGIYYANYWNTYNETNFISPAFRLYTNYDGANKTYGNTNVTATNPIPADGSIYAAINNSSDAELHLMAINKKAAIVNTTFDITANTSYTTAEVWQLDGSSTAIAQKLSVPIIGNSFTYPVPAHSAIHFVLKSGVLPAYNMLLTGTVDAYNNVNLHWPLQTDCAELTVQSSRNGFDFSTNKNCTIATTSLSVHNPFVFSNQLFYRLKNITTNNAINYSNIVKLGILGKNNLIVVPNPAKNFVTIQTPFAYGTITIYDSYGKKIRQIINTQLNQRLNIENFTNGVYYIQYQANSVEKVLKMIKSD